MFSPAELRRLAFVHLVHRLGVPLATAGAILDEPSDAWRSAVARQVHELEDLITRARGTDLFEPRLARPTEHPIIQRPQIAETLDRMVAGTTFDQLAAEHTRHT